MYIKNRRKSSKFNGLGSYQTLCLTESFVLRNRLLFIYLPLRIMARKTNSGTEFKPNRNLNFGWTKSLRNRHAN